MARLRYILIIVLIGISFYSMQAQGWGTIFRAGLTMSTYRGDLLQDNAGANLESLGYVSGFHLGAGARYKIDYLQKYGISFEVVYTQKGSRINYDGPSYFIFKNADNFRQVTTGTRNYALDISTSHFDIPLTFFAKPIKSLEFSAGVYASFLLRGEAGGNYRYIADGVPNVEFSTLLEQNFRNDRLADYTQPFTGETTTIRIAGDQFQVPRTQGAYFEHERYEGNLLRAFDFGVTGGISYYLTAGLYIGGRVQYGFINQFNPDMFISIKDLDSSNQPLLRNDSRQNLSYQLAIGFAF
jgi:hypothetical protein